MRIFDESAREAGFDAQSAGEMWVHAREAGE
jgi:hypothetical protein